MEMRIVKMDKIGYMGIPGSFSEVAANELLAQAGMTETELVPLVCAKNILEAMRCTGCGELFIRSGLRVCTYF